MKTISAKRVSILVASALASLPAFAAGITLTDAPFVTEGSVAVKSNLMFILDNSGSMAWDFLPDWVSVNQGGSSPSYCKGITGKADGSIEKGTTGATAMHCCVQSDGTAYESNCLNASTMRYPLPPFMSSDFSSIFYNPTITYEIPRAHDGSLMSTPSISSAMRNGFDTSSGSVNLTTGLNEIAWCADTGLTDCLRNGDYVLPGTVSGKLYQYPNMVKATGTAMVATSPTTTESRALGAHHYVIVPGAYCTTKKLTNCATQWGPDNVRKFPARLRWCNSVELKTTDDPATTSVKESCQALKTDNHKYPLYPGIVIKDGSPKAKISISSVTRYTSVNIADLKVGSTSGPDLVQTNVSYYASSSSSDTRRNGVRDALIGRINASGTGFLARATTNVGELEISAPAGATYNNKGFFPNVTGGTFTWNASAATFDNSGGTPERTPGKWHRIDLTGSGSFSSLYVDTTTGAVSTVSGTGKFKFLDKTTRKDCSGGVCAADTERQNYANWWTYYSTRMQMMKSAVALSFQTIDDKIRAGYFTINNADMSNSTSVTGGLNIDDFGTTWKQAWYQKILKETAGSGTPLRTALANAGRMYAGLISDIPNMKDPVQYTCQKNFTILSTDGYWNGGGGKDLNGNDISTDRDGDGTPATLADIADYYYKTDLRATGGVCSNLASNNIGGAGTSGANFTGLCDKDDVPPSPPDDNNTKQHMVVSTVGLGIDGVMQYRSGYAGSPSSDDLPDDYQAVTSGTGADPAQGICSWQTSGACKWPAAGTNKQENIDDLWHAAVNAKGAYYSARTPQELRESLETMLLKITATTGAAAAATTSNPNVTTGDNFVFSSSFRTVDWYGELVRQTMDPFSGVIAPTVDWSLQQKMDAAGERSGANGVHTFDKDAADGKKAFSYSALNSSNDAVCDPPVNEKGCFNVPKISSWSQWSSLGSSEQLAAAGSNLVNFLNGNTSYEGTLYRNREHTLGDIVSSEAVYLGRYLYSYDSSWYPNNGTARANPTVFVAANDGMLHAVNANDGSLRWSYVPSMVLSNMYKLADKTYSGNHRYFVDGSPVTGDINNGGLKTILVTGLAGGGQGYFAMDVSNATTPNALWEFRKRPAAECITDPGIQRVGKVVYDCDLGHSFGNPVIANVSGIWVVMVTSGYNNHTDGGDGKGYLYILNAYTGEPVGPKKISTGVGNTTTPSGLSKIAAWADNAMTENIVQYVYGGDYLGNLWRFDVVGGGVTKLTTFPNQPITAKPELGEVTGGGKTKPVVFVPTGSLVGANDLSNTDQQSFYAIWDAQRNSMAVPTTLVTQPVTGGATTDHSSSACNSVFDDHGNLGWKINFPVAKERGTSDPTLAFGTLVFSTNAPSSTSVCNPSGFESWVWNIDYQCGGTVTTASGSTTVAATHYSGMSTRPNVVVLPSGVVKSITRVSGEKVENMVAEVRISGKGGTLRKISWRELTK